MNSVITTEEVVKSLPCLQQKFVVDLANGIDVVRDHLRTQQSQRFWERLKNDLTGSSARCQQSINASLADGVEGSFRWLTELTGSVEMCHYAITQVNDRVNQLVCHTAEIAHYAADTRQLLQMLAEQTRTRLLAVEQRLQRVELKQDATFHLGQVFSRWQAGCYQQFSLAGRCYAALEELRWGAFGDLLRGCDTRQHNVLMEDLRAKTINQMRLDARTALERHDRDVWLAAPDRHFSDGLAYQGDWSHPQYHPVVFATTQTDQAVPLGMPSRCTAERLAGTMVDEVFGRVQP